MTKTRSRSYLAKLTLALGLLGLAASGSAYAEDQEEKLARDLVPSQKPLYKLGHDHIKGYFGVEAWVDNPDLTYRVGQDLKVYVRPKQTSYITVLNVGSSGNVAVIFPNHFQQDSKVHAGDTIVIPAKHSDWRIKIVGPPGIELIQVIASRHRLDDLIEPWRLAATSAKSPILSLDRSAEIVARDLVPQLKHDSYDKDKDRGIGVFKNILVRVLPREYGSLVPPFRGTFGLTLRTERPIYKIGDSVRMAVEVKQDCQLSVVSVGTSGRAVQLFPNKHQPYNVLRAGQTLIVPSPDAPIQFKAQGPAGVEGLMATCRSIGGSTAYTQVGEADFAAIDGLKGVTRDLVAVATASEEPVEHVSGSFIVWN